ncbi:vitamin K epoxide reductase family protein [Mycetocola tolaasinivorans]|uniref:Vitamin K epoxide reductase family protein n=1 Tax=Mycetocola tolaasinivorans TaxID=76635 RepID=A0A3L6ZYH3_9MICO|nr:vitamin K epoxide reductase family protein [Mycetocola tolaasinivorans]RLP72778.1 vitamin K epoxide reductase family protein [Mycetocola tolaasinivorans]
MTSTETTRPPRLFASYLIVAGILGWIPAFILTMEKIANLENPKAALSCDFSLVVQCGANLSSWQGSVFGFPNPIIGLAAWIAPIVVGVALLAGARFARWFWILFNVGMLGGIVFVIWLISQSIFDLGTLCVYCMWTWAVMIPTFLVVTLVNLREGRLGGGESVRRVATGLLQWIIPIVLACYIIVALIAQFRLDVISYL